LPTGFTENVTPTNFTNGMPAGAYRVQLMVSSALDGSAQTATFYFQVVP
jgi:hypothetical protein